MIGEDTGPECVTKYVTLLEVVDLVPITVDTIILDALQCACAVLCEILLPLSDVSVARPVLLRKSCFLIRCYVVIK